MSTTDIEVSCNFEIFTTKLKSIDYNGLISVLEELPTFTSLLTTQADLLWSCIPSSHLSQLASSCLQFDKDSNIYINVFVTLISCMMSSPNVLHSISFINYTPILMKIGYGPDSVVKEMRQLSLECVECVSYIPECQSILLHNNALSIIVRTKHNFSSTILTNLQENTAFCNYSQQITDVLQNELCSFKDLDKYEYCEHILRVLSCFEPFHFPNTHNLLLLLRDLFLLLRNKVNLERQLLALRASSQLLSLFDIHSLCEYLNFEKKSVLSLNELITFLLLVANLILVNFKLWLDVYMHSGHDHYSHSLSMISYTYQLMRLLEQVEENDCVVLRGSDKCIDFICNSILTIEDISINLCHLMVFADENSNNLSPSLSHAVLRLLSIYLADHELDKHIDVLAKLCPVLIRLLCNLSMDKYFAEINKFDISLLKDYSTLNNYCVNLEENLSNCMSEFLPAALNLSQHTQIPLAQSGYLHLLIVYFSKLYVSPIIGDITSESNLENKSVIFDLILTNITNIPVDYSLYKLAVSLILINKSNTTQSTSQLENKLMKELINGLSGCEFISYLPQNLAATLQHIVTSPAATPLRQYMNH
ncbi:hypothetical protein LOD99_14126 [Oopsacas minuta]|uniref:Uncharacterized protein n=1 Tax=Oopsacas minuta TaxID=111878 RepID=A0AAV7KGR4_9METZ|nr:hypothetical protein LOD99_14126 [Oopsacas minuta]